MSKVLFIGGPGNISRHSVRELLDAGHQVSILTHKNTRDDSGILPECNLIEGDRMDISLIKKTVTELQPEAVVDVCGFTPDQVALLAEQIDGICRQYVFISTCDVYGYPLSKLPQRESDPWNAPNCSYAANKVLCENLIHEKVKQSAVTIVRPAYSMGPRFLLTATSRSGGFYLIPRLRAGLPVLSPDDGCHLMHASNAADTGRMLARTVLSEKSFGKSYTLGAPNAISYDEYLRRIAAVLGVSLKLVHVPVEDIYRIGAGEIEKENLLNDLTKYDVEFSMEGFLHDYPDFEWKHPIEEAIGSFIEMQDRLGKLNDPHDYVEDRVIEAFAK